MSPVQSVTYVSGPDTRLIGGGSSLPRTALSLRFAACREISRENALMCLVRRPANSTKRLKSAKMRQIPCSWLAGNSNIEARKLPGPLISAHRRLDVEEVAPEPRQTSTHDKTRILSSVFAGIGRAPTAVVMEAAAREGNSRPLRDFHRSLAHDEVPTRPYNQPPPDLPHNQPRSVRAHILS